MADKTKIEFKNRKIEVSFDRTVQVNQYEPIRLHAGFSADISDNVNLIEAYEEVFIMLENTIDDELTEITGDKL